MDSKTRTRDHERAAGAADHERAADAATRGLEPGPLPVERETSSTAVIPLPGSSGEGTVLRTLLMSALIESTELVEISGDIVAASLFRRHDRLLRDLSTEYGGQEIDKTDGFLLLFERPIHAVFFARAYHEALTEIDQLEARIGIHLGEVVVRRNAPADVAQGAKPLEVEGLAKPTTARLMSLAGPGQTLLTRSAFDVARRSAVDAGGEAEHLRWLAHGRYTFQGVEDPVEVFEVGEEGRAPLVPPQDSAKAARVRGDDAAALGWRPAPGLPIPGRKDWKIERKLGESGLVDVWLAGHAKTRERRMFGFCYEASQLQRLKRELSLLLLLKEQLGEREDIARVLDWDFDEAPFYIESEYTAEGNLEEWAEARGGIGTVPLADRLELVAQVAEALAAAHASGVVHKDVNPTNVLIWRDTLGRLRARLTGFGIGTVIERERLLDADITGLEISWHSAEPNSGGTQQIFMAPELIEGRNATVQADVYALGVMLFQMAVGDLHRALATGWRRELDDDLLADDIAAAVDGDPQRRLASCAELAQRLRTLEQRRAQRAAERQARRARERGRKRRRLVLALAVVPMIFAITVGVLALRIQREAQRSREQARQARELAYTAIAANLLTGVNPTWGSLVALEIRDPDARQIASDTLHGALENPVLLGTLGEHDSDVFAAAFSPDGTRVLSASGDRAARVTDLRDGRLVTRLDGHTGSVFHASFSPDGARIVTASGDGTARLWDARSGEETMRFEGHGSFVYYASFSPDGTRVATGSRDRTARIWNVSTGDEVMRLDGHADRVQGASFSPDGTRVVTCSRDLTAKVWDARAGGLIATMSGHQGAIYDAVFSPDGTRVATVSQDMTARVWDARTGSELVRLDGHRDWIWRVEFSADGSRVLTASSDKSARIWHVATGEEIAHLKGHTGRVYDASFSPDGSRVVTGSSDATVRLWNLSFGEEIARMDGHSARVNAAVFSPDGATLLSASNDATARVWSVESGEETIRIDGHEDWVGAAAFNRDGTRIITGSRDRTARIWNARNGAELARLQGHTEDVNTVAFSRDGSRAVTGSSDVTVRIWNALTGKELTRLHEQMRIFTVSFNPGGTQILTQSEDRIVRIRDAQDGEELIRFDDGAYSAAYSHDGARVVTGRRDGTARIWNARTGDELVRLEGHTDRIYTVAFNRDGTRLVTGSGDNTARIWNAETGDELARLTGHTNPIFFAAFSPDGAFVATGSSDNTARIWTVTDDYTTYLQSRIRARTPLCLSVDFRRETLLEAPEVAEHRAAACERCAPIFFELLGDAPESDWRTYVKAWRTYQTCLGRRQEAS